MAKKGIKFLFLSFEDLLNIRLSVKAAIQLCHTSLIVQGRQNEVEMPPKIGLHTRGNTFIHAMPSFIKSLDIAGMKWVAQYPDNRAIGLPTVTGLCVINDASTGLPLSVMDASFITAIRTAGVSACSAKLLAKKNASHVGIIGAGIQGKYNAIFLCSAIPTITHITVYDNWKPSIDNFMEEVGSSLAGKNVNISIGTTMEDTMKEQDIVVTATTLLKTPIYNHKMVKNGCLVLPITTTGWARSSLQDFDQVFTDDSAQFKEFGKNLFDHLPEGLIPEVGRVLNKYESGRTNDSNKIICFDVGLATNDIIFGSKLLEMAKELKLGNEIELMKEGTQLPLPPLE